MCHSVGVGWISQLRLQSSKVNTFSSIWKLPVRKPSGTGCSGLQAQGYCTARCLRLSQTVPGCPKLSQAVPGCPRLSQAVADPHWVHIPTTSLPFSTHFLSLTTHLEQTSPVPPGCAKAGTGRAAEGSPREASPSWSRRHLTRQSCRFHSPGFCKVVPEHSSSWQG